MGTGLAAVKKLLKAIGAPMRRFGMAVARVQTWVLLTLFYFLVILPAGLFLRLFGWDPLELKNPEGQAQSFWVRRGPAPRTLTELERPF